MPQLDPPEVYMRRAIAAARHNPRWPFGAVLVHGVTGEVLSEGYNRSAENPIWHGEIDAINRCASEHPDVEWSAIALYSTAEPCVMCQGAVAWAGIARVVFGTSIRFIQRLGWKQIDILANEVVRRTPFHRCRLSGGVLELECNALFEEAHRLATSTQRPSPTKG